MIKILVYGLSGSGKTTFAKKLADKLAFVHLESDTIRRMFKDWDFSQEGRERQSKRMLKLTKMVPEFSGCVVDFICPYEKNRKGYDFTIWMDTVEKSKYPDTDKIFQKPNEVDYKVNNFQYDDVINNIMGELVRGVDND